jgi:hypothetical protein
MTEDVRLTLILGVPIVTEDSAVDLEAVREERMPHEALAGRAAERMKLGDVAFKLLGDFRMKVVLQSPGLDRALDELLD